MEGVVTHIVRFTLKSVTVHLGDETICILKPHHLVKYALAKTVWETRKNPFPVIVGAFVKLERNSKQPPRGPTWYDLVDIEYPSLNEAELSDQWVRHELLKPSGGAMLKKAMQSMESNISFRKRLLNAASACNLSGFERELAFVCDVANKHDAKFTEFTQHPIKIIKQWAAIDPESNKWKLLEALSRFYGISYADIDAEWVDSLMLEAERAGGHMYLPMAAMTNRAAQLHASRVARGRTDILDVAGICNSKPDMFVVVDHIVYRKSDYDVERGIAAEIAQIIDGDESSDESGESSDEFGDQMNEQQLKVCHTLLHSPQGRITCVAGFPGVGKSFVVAEVCKAWIAQRTGHILVLAPTGKASDRLRNELRSKDVALDDGRVCTIHRALMMNTISFNEKSKSPFKDTTLVVVDEMTMVDAFLFYRLLCACRGARLLLLGDPDQLPSIDRGDVFRQLLQTDVNVIYLTQRYRSVGDILQLSDEVRMGLAQLVSRRDVQYVEAEHPEDVLQLVAQIRQRHPDGTVQILVPTNTGPCGALRINYMTHQERFDGDCANIPPVVTEFMIRSKLCENDQVVITKNDPDLNYFNGQIGVINDVEDTHFKVQLEEIVTVPKEHVLMGYAITVHKSQGSEYENVVLVLHSSHGRNLTRAIVYTAVTRAKKMLYIVGTNAEFERAVNTVHPKRNSRLATMLAHLAPQKTSFKS